MNNRGDTCLISQIINKLTVTLCATLKSECRTKGWGDGFTGGGGGCPFTGGGGGRPFTGGGGGGPLGWIAYKSINK